MPPEKVKASDEKYCLECGAAIKRTAEICPHCGVRQVYGVGMTAITAPNGKNRIAAALFAILLGGLGAHKFYLGDMGMGLLYLLFCWTSIPTIVGIVEGIMFILMTDDEFIVKYGQK